MTSARAEDTNAPQPYTRIANPDTNTTQLQIALRKFVPRQGSGPTIWLTAVMHIGEPRYYQELQKFLNKQTVVLYEGINPDAHPHHVHDTDADETAPAQTAGDTNQNYSMQSTLAHSLGLVFQLDAIDYDRTNFLNSDLTIEQIAQVMGERPVPANADVKNAPNASFNVLLQIMDGSSFLGSIFKAGLEFIGDNPKLRAVAKLTMIEAIGRLKGNFADIQGLPPDWQKLLKVLIEARNQNLLRDLKEELQKVPKTGSVAVFYGAGHMDDLETRVIRDLNYKPSTEKWMTAFSVDLRQTGLTPFEAEWMRNIIKQQMEQIQPAKTK